MVTSAAPPLERSAPPTTGAAAVVLLAWIGGLAGLAVGLRAAAGALAPPPVGSLDALARWSIDTAPEVMAASLVRLVAELTAWYALAVTALYGVGALVRSRLLTRAARRLAAPALRHVLESSFGLALAPAALAPLAALPAVPPPALDAIIAVHPAASLAAAADPSPSKASPMEDGAAIRAPAATPPARPFWSLGPEVDPPAAGEGATMRPLPLPGAAPPTTYRVEAGESFWTIADELLADAWHRPPSVAEVDAYWRQLMAANWGRLVHDDEPDLLFAGQVLDLPPPPAVP